LINTEIQRNVIINMLRYFHKNTKYCHLLKMMKLIFLSDFYSLRESGDVISGLEYKKYPMGPVPEEFYRKLKNNELSTEWGIRLVKNTFDRNIDETDDYAYDFHFDKESFDDDYFSKNEIEILKKVVYTYKELKSKDISIITHKGEEGYPWLNTEVGEKIEFKKLLGKTPSEKQLLFFNDVFEVNQKIRERNKLYES